MLMLLTLFSNGKMSTAEAVELLLLHGTHTDLHSPAQPP
jgi:hypothetical protein